MLRQRRLFLATLAPQPATHQKQGYAEDQEEKHQEMHRLKQTFKHPRALPKDHPLEAVSGSTDEISRLHNLAPSVRHF